MTHGASVLYASHALWSGNLQNSLSQSAIKGGEANCPEADSLRCIGGPKILSSGEVLSTGPFFRQI